MAEVRPQPGAELGGVRVGLISLAPGADQNHLGRRIVCSWSSTACTTSSSPTRASAATPALARAATVATRLCCAARRPPYIGGPAIEEADPGGRKDGTSASSSDWLRPAIRRIAAISPGSSTGSVTTIRTCRPSSPGSAEEIAPRGRWRAAMVTTTITVRAPTPRPAPPPDGEAGDDRHDQPGHQHGSFQETTA